MPICYYLDLVDKIQAICLDFHAYQTIIAEAATAESVISAPPQYADCTESLRQLTKGQQRLRPQ